MRPARIQVFDGLRMATEHVEHLQDSLQSSIQDLREAVGLRMVIRGFEVERDGDGFIVQPGLAFDGHARRLALDEPRRVDAVIPPGRDVQYVCLEYETVEEGEVEGRPTLIFDSIAVSFQDAAPGPDDPVLAVAKLVRTEGDPPGFEVLPIDGARPPLQPAEPTPPSEPTPPAEATPPADAGGASEPAAEPSTEERGAPPAEPGAPAEAPAPTAGEPAAPGTESGAVGAEPAAAGTEPPTAGAEPTPPAAGAEPTPPAAGAEPASSAGADSATPAVPSVRAEQGLVRLPATGVPEVDPIAALSTALAEHAERDGSAQLELSIPLATTEVAGGLDVMAVTCTVHLTATVSRPDGTVRRLESVAHGDVTLGQPAPGRFGLSTVRSVPAPPAGEGSWIGTELSEDGIAALPLAHASADASARELLRGLRVVADVHQAAPDGVGISCALTWSGPADERRMKTLEQEVTAVTWSAAVGWKALGR